MSLYLALDPHAQTTEMLVQQPFGISLRQAQRVVVLAGDIIETYMGDLLASGDDIGRVNLDPRGNEAGVQPPRSSNSRVRLQITSALDLSVRCGA